MSVWDTCTRDISVVINSILKNVHPDQFRAGTAVYEGLAESDDDFPFLRHWRSAFNGLEVIVNRQTPPHRDAKGWRTCYDLLITTGTYGDGDFHVPDLGIRLRYKTGTIVCILGALIRHAAYTWGGKEERSCWAYFMRRELFWHFRVRAPDWQSMQSCKPCYGIFT